MKKIIPAILMSSLGLLANSANADLAAIGLPDPVSFFPNSITDTNNVALQLCLDGDPLLGICTFDPPSSFPGNAWAATVGFGAEAFYNRAQSKLAMPNGRRAVLSMGVEAAYLPAIPANGNQFVFGRIRYRIDLPGPGTYKVYHPYLTYPGCQPETYVEPVGGKKVINYTLDVGGGAPYTNVLTSETGPFLKWDPAVAPLAPVGYLGDAQIAHQIVGSKCNTNVFRVDGPNIGGAGVNTFSTNLFNITGKIAGGGASPLVVDRVTYDHTGLTTRLNVFAQASPLATVSLSPVAGLNVAAVNLTTDTLGNFFTQVSGNATPPASVTVTATSPTPGVPVTTLTVPVTDQVDVIPAVYNVVNKTLAITARSSEKTTPPTLTATVGKTPMAMNYDALTGNYTITAINVLTPPVSVTVTSTKGGKDVENIQD